MMDAIKRFMPPKWWLIGVGAIFTILGLMTYTNGEGSAELAWGADYTDYDVFYERAWAANILMIAIICLVSGQFIEGKSQAILAMTIAGVNILSFALVYLAGSDLDYGFLEPASAAPGLIAAAGLLLSGYLHLDD
jgi:hypothetical protein